MYTYARYQRQKIKAKEKTVRATSGVRLHAHQRFKENVKDVTYINNRILKTPFQFRKGPKTHINSVYALVTSKTHKEKNIFYYELQRTLNQTSKREEIILVGDLNARIGSTINNGIKKIH